jgi:UPF0176 protein
MRNQVASFYQFMRVYDTTTLKSRLYSLCQGLGLYGTVLVSEEGINGTLAGVPDQLEQCIEALRRGIDGNPGFDRLELKFSQSAECHFDKLKVKVKREIITFGQCEADPLRYPALAVAAADWTALLDDPDILLLDTRNRFEVQMGRFAGAVDPGLQKFSDFASYISDHLDSDKNKKIAMYCTGGIRCEKASAYMLANGYKNIFLLQGGILKYLQDVPEKKSRWLGDCFVFDQRVALRHGLAIAEDLHGYCP